MPASPQRGICSVEASAQVVMDAVAFEPSADRRQRLLAPQPLGMSI